MNVSPLSWGDHVQIVGSHVSIMWYVSVFITKELLVEVMIKMLYREGESGLAGFGLHDKIQKIN